MRVGKSAPVEAQVLVSETCPTNLLRGDLLSALEAKIDFWKGEVAGKIICPQFSKWLITLSCEQYEVGIHPNAQPEIDLKETPTQDLKVLLAQVPCKLWAKDRMDVGLL